MKANHKNWVILGAVALVLALAPVSQAQLNSNQANVNLNAVLSESLTVAAGPATVNFALPASGTAAGSAPVSITTSWVLAPARTDVNLYAYFSSAVALTDGGGNNIPTANVSGNFNGGGFNPFTSVTPFAANGLQLFNQAIAAANRNASRSDSLALQIDTTGLALPAGTYTGVLNIQAQAI